MPSAADDAAAEGGPALEAGATTTEEEP